MRPNRILMILVCGAEVVACVLVHPDRLSVAAVMLDLSEARGVMDV